MVQAARALWIAQPKLKIAAADCILARGAHHTGFSLSPTAGHLEGFAEMAGVEFPLSDEDATIRHVKEELCLNDVY